MDWYPDIYTGGMEKEKARQRILEIEAGKYRGNTYLITLSANPVNQLDILSVHQLQFAYIRRSCPLVVGLAAGKEAACRLLVEIVETVMQKTGDVKLREYFLERSVAAAQDRK